MVDTSHGVDVSRGRQSGGVEIGSGIIFDPEGQDFFRSRRLYLIIKVKDSNFTNFKAKTQGNLSVLLHFLDIFGVLGLNTSRKITGNWVKSRKIEILRNTSLSLIFSLELAKVKIVLYSP